MDHIKAVLVTLAIVVMGLVGLVSSIVFGLGFFSVFFIVAFFAAIYNISLTWIRSRNV